jgi:hypothetical protein
MKITFFLFSDLASLKMADVGRSSIENDFMYGSNVASCHVYIRMRMFNI